MKKTIVRVIVALGLLAAPAIPFTALSARAQESKPVTGTLKGTIKSINDNQLVLTPSNKKNGEISFDLTASVTRTGSLAPGEAVSVSYYFSNGKRVATAIAGKKTK
jgi:hypothetical protein